VSFSIGIAESEAMNLWRPLSLTPGRLSRRNDFRFDGKAFSVMLVKEVAGSPDTVKCFRAGYCRKVPTIARKFSDTVAGLLS
jgi:hypothetical protein